MRLGNNSTAFVNGIRAYANGKGERDMQIPAARLIQHYEQMAEKLK